MELQVSFLECSFFLKKKFFLTYLYDFELADIFSLG